MKKADLDKLRKRDLWCWHCGADQDLVPHHRANRGMGSSKALDTLQNVILVCSQYNGLMESDAKVAHEARLLGHKISKFTSPEQSVFDNNLRKWYFLTTDGKKVVVNEPHLIL